jgi:hypothetical protein
MCDDLLDGRLFDGGRFGKCLLAVGLAGFLCLAASAVQEGRAQSLSEPVAPSVERERAPSARQAPSTRRVRPERSGPDRAGDLPSWAEPLGSSASSQDTPEPFGSSVQPMGPGENPGGPGGNPDPGNPVPLGGLEWLLAAGAGYGFWKLREEE